MNKVTKKLMSVLLALVMVISVVTVSPATETKAIEVNTTTKAVVTFAVEKLTIGQGYLVEPMQVEVKEGDTAASVFEKVMKTKGITYPSTESSWGFYLTAINNADTGVVDIPKEISAMTSATLWDGSSVNAPANNANDGNSLANKGLGSGSYNTMSGWMFMVNNANPGAGADQVKVKAGDVIRLQFSVYGYGADIGFDGSYYGLNSVSLSNKDALTAETAMLNTYGSAMLKDANVKTAYDNAMTVLKTYNVSQAITDSALKVLKQAEKTYEASQTVKPEYVTVGRASVKKVQNIKKCKAKISVNKMAGVTGYQYKYADNKKFKKATVKTTAKTSITTKKFKKKQRCYVKIRAYIKVNGSTTLGKWSKMKSVKITK